MVPWHEQQSLPARQVAPTSSMEDAPWEMACSTVESLTPQQLHTITCAAYLTPLEV